MLPDTRAVRLLLVELAHGSPLTTLDASTAPVLDALVAAGLVVAADEVAPRLDRRAGCRVQVDAPDGVLPALLRLVGETGLRLARSTAEASVALVWTEGEPPRGRLDDWMRSGTPHLVVREGSRRPVLGPYVVPGATACLRCVDAHLGEHDPRRASAGRAGRHHATAAAVASPTRPCAPWPSRGPCATSSRGAEGGVPATWSATVAMGQLPPTVTTYRAPPPLRLRLGRGPRRQGCRPRRADPHQYSLSSLPSIGRRCSREQVSQ